jgi:hypothetical protein
MRGNKAIIRAPWALEEWRVSKYRRTAILVDDHRYYIAEASHLGDAGWEYVLAPWPDDPADVPARTVVYDRAYLERQRRLRQDRIRQDRLGVVVLLATPIAGFLTHATKLRLQEAIGLDPLRATRCSLIVEYFLLLDCAALAIIAAFSGDLSERYWTLLLVLTAFLAADLLARHRSASGLDDRFLGLGEWLSCVLRKRG